MRTRKQIEVAMERAGSAMAHELRGVEPTSDLVMAWDTAFGDMQQINHLTGTPSYEALEAENKRLRDELARKQSPSPDAEYGELLALAEEATKGDWREAGHDGLDAMISAGQSKIILWRCNGFFAEGTEQADKDAAYIVAAQPKNVISILAHNAQLAERVAVLEADKPKAADKQFMRGLQDLLEDESCPANERLKIASLAIDGALLKATPHPHADEAAKVEWISVDDRLPSTEPLANGDTPSVLVHWKSSALASNLLKISTSNTQYLALNKENFTHWAYLPAPPSPAEGE